MASMLNYLPRNVSWSWVQYGGFDKNKWLASRLMQPKIGTRKNVMGKRRQPAQYWPYIQSADWSIETSSLALGIRCEKGLFYLTTRGLWRTRGQTHGSEAKHMEVRPSCCLQGVLVPCLSLEPEHYGQLVIYRSQMKWRRMFCFSLSYEGFCWSHSCWGVYLSSPMPFL